MSRRAGLSLAALFLMAAGVSAAPVARPAPVPPLPVAPVVPVVDDYFGTKVTDDYRWMEDRTAPAFVAWAKAENAHARGVIARIPRRDALERRVAARTAGANAATAASASVITAAATVPFAFAGAHTNSWLLALCLVVRGFGLGAVTIPVMAAAFIGLDKQEIAHSSVITRMVQQIGGSFGTAVLAVVLASAVAAHPGAPAAGFHTAFWWAAGFSALAVLLSLWLPGAVRAAPVPPAAPASAGPGQLREPHPASPAA